MTEKDKSQAAPCSYTCFENDDGDVVMFGPNDNGYINEHVRAAAKHITIAIDLYCFGHYGASNQQIPDDHGLVIALNALKLVDIDTAPYANTAHDPSLFDIPVVEERKIDQKHEEMLKQILTNMREEEE